MICHMRGGYTVTESPQRIAVLDVQYADHLLAVERLSPDLIICTEVHDQHVERLSRIARVLMFKRNESWQTILSLFGELTGKRAEAKRIIADYHRRTALLSEELAPVLAGKSMALIRPLDSLVRIHSASHRTGAVLYRDLGFPVPLFVADTPTRLSILQLTDFRLYMPATIFYLVMK